MGAQFNEQRDNVPSLILGTSIDLYNKNELSIPLELLLHFVPEENPGKTILFPRITANIKYNIISINQTWLYIQAGVGIPILFPYLLDFSPVLGISYKQLRIDIRNIFYFDLDGNAKVEINRWPIMVVVLGISI